MLSLELAWLVLSTPAAIGWLLLLMLAVTLVIATGLAPPTLLSLVMVARASWRRLRARHAGPPPPRGPEP